MDGHDLNAMISMIGAFRQRARDISLTSIVAFLHVCENEGVTVKELAYLCRVSEASISRALQTLRLPSARRVGTTHGGLVRVFQHPDDGRRRVVYLTEDGCELRNAVDRTLSARARIPDAAGA